MTSGFNCVTIIGVGLIGGSLARDLKKHGLAKRIKAAGRTRSNLESALSLGLVDQIYDDAAEAVKDADLVVLCIPVCSMPETLKVISPNLEPGAIISDVGSTKTKLIQDLTPLMPVGVHFVPAHPIAGSERTGAGAAINDLFKNRTVILTPVAGTDLSAVSRVGKLWEAIGARVEMMDPTLHDMILGAVSHLPHMVAYALVEVIRQWDEKQPMLRFSAGGFEDFTRVASSSPEMWRDVCLENKDVLVNILEGYQDVLQSLVDLVGNSDANGLMEFFSNAKQVKEKLGK